MRHSAAVNVDDTRIAAKSGGFEHVKQNSRFCFPIINNDGRVHMGDSEVAVVGLAVCMKDQ